MANTLNLGNGDWATKENSLLGYNSENGNYKPLPFDFTRASNGTFVNKSGLIETAASGVPRIDFLGNTSGALLLEPQRSNAITNSDSFGSTGWGFVTTGTAIAPIVTDDYAISPDGTQNAQRVQFNLGGGSPSRTVIRQSLSTQTDWFLSVWMKSTDGTEQKILWHSTSDTNETIVTGEWKRFTFSRNGLSNSWAGLCLNAGVSTVDTADILVYGFQAEQGSYATSLINTQGSAVTRVADACNNGGNDQVINSTEGVLYFEGSALADDGTNRWAAALSDGTNYERVQIIYLSDNSIAASVISSNTSQCSFNYSGSSATDFNKIAISYKQNDFKMYVNGTQVGSETSGNAPNGLDTLGLERPTGVSELYGNCKDLRVYNTALTDAELIALTS
jgi:hypothetical protein